MKILFGTELRSTVPHTEQGLFGAHRGGGQSCPLAQWPSAVRADEQKKEVTFAPLNGMGAKAKRRKIQAFGRGWSRRQTSPRRLVC